MTAHAQQQPVADPAEAAALIELYYEKGWTDGLPVVPPSELSVQAMLDAAGLAGDAVVGEIPERFIRITADKVAINAVLAGCRPEYMPVVVAAVKGLCHPAYGYHGPATSTGGAAVAVIVNGPIAGRLGINAKDNVFGPGVRANATIGRAVRLFMMNALNTRPGLLDRSTQGHPGKYTLCFAENEEGSPWEPMHVERGFRSDQSTVTIWATEGYISITNNFAREPEPLLQSCADALGNMGSRNIWGQSEAAVIFAYEFTDILRQAGWSKAQVRQCLYDNARQTMADLKRVGRMPGEVQPGDENEWRYAVREPGEIILLCAGGRAGVKGAVMTGWGTYRNTHSVTIPVEAP